ILRYVAVDDCGTMINPMVVEGQIHGGIAHGIGNAMLEEIVYDGAGQLLTGTLMDYALPRAADVPKLEVHHVVTPSPLNPLGVKGSGRRRYAPGAGGHRQRGGGRAAPARRRGDGDAADP